MPFYAVPAHISPGRHGPVRGAREKQRPVSMVKVRCIAASFRYSVPVLRRTGSRMCHMPSQTPAEKDTLQPDGILPAACISGNGKMNVEE